MGYYERRRAHVCPVETGLELISGRWKARILWKLHQRTLRFGELRREIDGITEKMLAQQLRELEGDDLVERTTYPTVPPRVEYALSSFGRTLGPILEQIAAWGEAHNERIVAIIERDHGKHPATARSA
jgi:DNA-binding HxlR family transcriptional regulator